MVMASDEHRQKIAFSLSHSELHVLLNLISQSFVILIHVIKRKRFYHIISYEKKNVYYIPSAKR